MIFMILLILFRVYIPIPILPTMSARRGIILRMISVDTFCELAVSTRIATGEPSLQYHLATDASGTGLRERLIPRSSVMVCQTHKLLKKKAYCLLYHRSVLQIGLPCSELMIIFIDFFRVPTLTCLLLPAGRSRFY